MCTYGTHVIYVASHCTNDILYFYINMIACNMI